MLNVAFISAGFSLKFSNFSVPVRGRKKSEFLERSIRGQSSVSSNLTSTAKSYVVTYDNSTGQLFYTASSAIGGGGGGSTFPYTGTAVISGSLTITKGVTDYTNTLGANSHILLNNTSSGGHTSISYVTAGNLTGKIRSDYGGSMSYISTFGNHYFYTGGDASSGPAKFFISNSGNVGIGTTSPSYKLDTSGDINFTGTLYQNGSPYTASNATSASYALTASYAMNGGGGGGTPSSVDDINTGTGTNTVTPENQEQSKYTTVNIFNFLNFS
jgi:hypothetical protein